jgi:hypothetical protein
MLKGDRVRLSHQAKQAGIRRYAGQKCSGSFVGLEKGFYIKVLWDGNTSVGTGYHPDFIELDVPTISNGER